MTSVNSSPAQVALFESVGCAGFGAPLLGLLGPVRMVGLMVGVCGQFATNGSLANADLLGDLMLSLFLLVEPLNGVPHRRPGFVAESPGRRCGRL